MSHKNTTFLQILQFVSRHEFNKIVKNHNGEARSKGFSCWSQFSAMLFAQLSGQKGLRGIEAAFAMNSNYHYHLGIGEVKRSTLSYANDKRSHEIYKDLFYHLLGKMQKKNGRHKFKFNNPLYSIDASTIDLCQSQFPWAHFRKKKAGIKLHVKLDHSDYTPSYLKITTAKCHESKTIHDMPQKKGDVLVFDRGYNNYSYFSSCCDKGIYFVTRLKTNVCFDIIGGKDIEKYDNILFDNKIQLSSDKAKNQCKHPLRIIRSYDPELKKTINLLTNNHKWSQDTIAAIYKDRWQIEVFYKTIKQNLKIKSFFGTSENAVMTQIWIVMIAYLILKYMTFLSSRDWTVGTLMALLPMLLFRKGDLFEWLNAPLNPDPPDRNMLIQGSLF